MTKDVVREIIEQYQRGEYSVVSSKNRGCYICMDSLWGSEILCFTKKFDDSGSKSETFAHRACLETLVRCLKNLNINI